MEQKYPMYLTDSTFNLATEELETSNIPSSFEASTLKL
jgi:hypothetical protein